MNKKTLSNIYKKIKISYNILIRELNPKKLNNLDILTILNIITYLNKVIKYYSITYLTLKDLLNEYNNILKYHLFNNITLNNKKLILIDYLLNYYNNYYILINFFDFISILNK